MSPFIVFALPRSRTAWLARFLSYGEYECAHEQLRHMRSMADVRAWLAQDYVGAAETGAAPWWRLVRHIRPDARVLVVRRPVEEVVNSLMALDLRGVVTLDRATLTAEIHRLDRRLDLIEHRVPRALSVSFADLGQEAVCARVFEHCTGYRHDPAWWRLGEAVNVQANMRALMRHHAAHCGQMERLASEAKRATLRLMARPVPVEDGIEIREEEFETFWRDGQTLFAAHADEVGAREGANHNPNLALFRALDSIGALHLMTARCNGRLFGYLGSVIGPSLEDADLTVATQGVFYVSPEFRGLGARLQRASLDALRARGVREVIMRAGVRGAGPKAWAMYRRMGAAEFGRLYSLTLAA